jgi:hypothetical protein
LHNVYAPSPTANQSIYWDTTNSRYQLNTIGGILGYTPANDALVVHLAGTETITGQKTFTNSLIGNTITLDGSASFSASLSLKQSGLGILASTGYATLASLSAGNLEIYFGDTNLYAVELNNSLLTASRQYKFPDANGTLALIGGAGVGTVTSVAALTLGTSGTDLSSTVANPTTTPVITLNVPTASAANRGALSAADWSTFNTKVGSVTASSPLASSGGSTPNITIQQSSGSQDGYLSSTDWTTFNNKQAAGNYITSLTGEATGTGPGATAVTLNNASVTAKILTGINITGGTVQATDTMLTAFGKLQNQINGLVGGSIYQGTWNASTNTPALASGVGTKGYYYIVSVAGTTNLDGITDWFVGDWAIFDGTAWQQVDNTDAVVSVNGQTGAVSLTTDNIPEGATNQYYLDSRARAALSFTAGSGAYNSTTGVITIPTNTSQLTNGANFITLGSLSGTAPIVYSNTTGAISITQAGTASNGYLSSTDWNTFNNKQATLSLTTTGTSGAATLVGTTLNIPNYGSALTGYVPYTGATSDLNLGNYNFTTNTANAKYLNVAPTTAGASVVAQFSNSGNGSTLNINSAGGSGQYLQPAVVGDTVIRAETGNLLMGVNGAANYIKLGNSTQLWATFSVGGAFKTEGSITASISALGTAGTTFLTQTSGLIQSRTAAQVLSDIGGQAAITNPVTGTGTANMVARWTSSSTVSTGVIYDNGTNVAIGHGTNPNLYRLDVFGIERVRNNGWAAANSDANKFINYTVGDTSDYIQAVILLHPIYNGTNIGWNLCSGTFYQTRGGTGMGMILNKYEVNTSSAYNGSQGSVDAIGIYGNGQLVTCLYGGVKYLAFIPFYVTSAVSFKFEGYSESTGSALALIEYRNSSTGAILNSEVYNSITAFIPGANKYYSGGLAVASIISTPSSIEAGDYIKATCTTAYNGDGFRVYASASGAAGSQPGIGYWTAAGSKRFINQLDVSSDIWSLTSATGVSLIAVTQGGDSTFKGTTHTIYTNAGATVSFDINVTRGRFYQALTVDGNVTAAALIKSGGTSSQYLMADGSVSTLSNPVTGTGSTNYVTKWTSTSNVGYGIIYDNGTTAMIGTTTTSIFGDKFKVVGGVTNNGLVRFENSVNQSDLNHGTLHIVNTAAYAIGNDASIAFALNREDNSYQDPRASIGAKTESSYGGALVFNTRSDVGTYSEKLRIAGSGLATFASSIYCQFIRSNNGTNSYSTQSAGSFVTADATTGGINIFPYLGSSNYNASIQNGDTGIISAAQYGAVALTSHDGSSIRISRYYADLWAENTFQARIANGSAQFFYRVLAAANGAAYYAYEAAAATLGTAAGSWAGTYTAGGNNGNGSYFDQGDIRTSTGTDWTSAGYRLQHRIDNTYMGFIQFSGNGNNGGVGIGTGLSSVSRTSVPLRFYINSSGDATFTNTLTISGQTYFGSNAIYNAGDQVDWFLQGPANGPTIRMKYSGGTANRSGSLAWLDNAGGRTNALTWVDGTVTIPNRLYAEGGITISTSTPSITFTATGLGRTSTIGMTDGANMYINSSSAGNLYIGGGTTTYVSGAMSVSGAFAGAAGTLSGQFVQGGGASRSTNGTTIVLTYNTAWTANSDPGDGGRFLSIVNDSTVTNAYSAVSFRVNPSSGGGGTNAMLDMKFVNTNSGQASTLYWTFNSPGGFNDRMSLTSGGALTAGSFFESSDSRLKQLIKDDYRALGIESVKARLYLKDGKEEVGYYAQDLEAILPSAVSKNDAGFLSLSYTQVHTAKIAIIEDEVTILKRRVAELESKLQA